jgi:hypothetical protein
VRAVEDRELSPTRRELAGCRAGRGGNVGQAALQVFDGRRAVLDGDAFTVRERNLQEHPLEAAPGLEQLRRGGLLGHVEVVSGAGIRCGHCSKKLYVQKPWPRSKNCQSFPSVAAPDAIASRSRRTSMTRTLLAK